MMHVASDTVTAPKERLRIYALYGGLAHFWGGELTEGERLCCGGCTGRRPAAGGGGATGKCRSPDSRGGPSTRARCS